MDEIKETPGFVTAILGFIGGGFGVAVWNYFTGRRKAKLEIGGLKDDQTTKWRDNALQLSNDILNKDKDIQAALRLVHTLEMEKSDLQDDLKNCIEKISDCECRENENVE